MVPPLLGFDGGSFETFSSIRFIVSPINNFLAHTFSKGRESEQREEKEEGGPRSKEERSEAGGRGGEAIDKKAEEQI